MKKIQKPKTNHFNEIRPIFENNTDNVEIIDNKKLLVENKNVIYQYKHRNHSEIILTIVKETIIHRIFKNNDDTVIWIYHIGRYDHITHNKELPTNF
jgi:hypothetical protein